jgi:hypothetical protein
MALPYSHTPSLLLIEDAFLKGCSNQSSINRRCFYGSAILMGTPLKRGCKGVAKGLQRGWSSMQSIEDWGDIEIWGYPATPLKRVNTI